jgi:prepilin-type N-terminal cleavage/methylation domain-containing protein
MNHFKHSLKNSPGFTLIELLIVTALVGIVMTAVLGLVITTQRHSYTSEEVVDVQQNLRVALDFMSRDLRLAGFGVADDAFILEAPQRLRCEDKNRDGDCLDADESDFLRFLTLTATGTMARIGVDGGITTTADKQKIALAEEKSARLLLSGGESAPVYVRIFRPSSRTQPLDRVFEVRPPETTEPPEIVAVEGFTESTVLRPGDLLARVDDPDFDGDGDPNTDMPQLPNQVDYRLVKADTDDSKLFDLVRVPTGVDPDDETTFQRVAGKIVEVQFQYLLEDGSETASVAGSDLERVRAIRITLVGATDATRTGNAGFNPGQGDNVKTRALSTVVELRNR